MSAIDAILPTEPPARPQRAETPASVREPARAAERPRGADGRDEPSTFADLVDAETSNAAASESVSDETGETTAVAPGAQTKTSKLARKLTPTAGRPIVAAATDATANPALIAQPQSTITPNPKLTLALASGDAAQTDAQPTADAEAPAAPQPAAPNVAAPPVIDFAAAPQPAAPNVAAAPVIDFAAAAEAVASTTPTTPAAGSLTPAPNAIAAPGAAAKPASPAATPATPAATPATPAATPATPQTPLDQQLGMQLLAAADAQSAATPAVEAQPAAADHAALGTSIKPADLSSLKPDAPAAQAPAAPAPQAPAAPALMLSAPAPAAASTNAAAIPTPAALNPAPDAAIQVYHRIVERHDGRSQRFELRLDPAELGRVDIRIEVNADKKVHAILAAHDSAALSDLVKGQKGLEQALKDSGLDLADGGLKFELSADTGRGFASSQGRSQSTHDPGAWPSDRAAGEVIALPTTPEAAAAAPAWRPARLNLVA